MKKIFRPICWAQELIMTIWYGYPVSGHIDYEEQPDGTLKCALCGHESKIMR